MQARILQVLQDGGAFLNIAFLGGTSLRFLFFLPRYSEDLDFSVLPSKKIDFENLLHSIKTNFEAENYKISIKAGMKEPVIGAFIKFPSLLYELGLSSHKDEVLSVKIEIDTNPPKGEVTATTLTRRYVVVNLSHYDKATLFAGKINAIFTRKYIKGRDLFDLVWILSSTDWPIPNIIFLNNALSQTEWKGPRINTENWKSVLISHISSIDWKKALEDVSPFLERESDKDLLTLENCNNLLDNFIQEKKIK